MRFSANLEHLRQNHPLLANRMAGIVLPERMQVTPSRQGEPTLFLQENGKSISLHSAYDPVQEARLWAEAAMDAPSLQFLVFGFGLGYPLEALLQRIPEHSRVVVIEPDAELFRAALETRPLTEVLTYKNIEWHIGEDPAQVGTWGQSWISSFAVNGFSPVRLKSVCEHYSNYIATLEQNLAQAIQNVQTEQNTRSALSRLFYKNWLSNISRLPTSQGIRDWKNQLAGQPAIIIAAGPSLDKNIQLLAGAQEKAHLLATATALRPLLENGIEPDFVIAIDPKEISTESFEAELPAKTQLVFHPFIPPAIVDRFEGHRIAVGLEHPFWELLGPFLGDKPSLGDCHSVSHAAILWARHLGCNPIILTGQDLALSTNRQHCSFAPNTEQQQFNLQQHQTTHYQEQRRRQGKEPVFLEAVDLFGTPVKTTRALDLFRDWFSGTEFNGTRILNATEGGIPIPGIENRQLKEILISFQSPKTTPAIPAPKETDDTPAQSTADLVSFMAELADFKNEIEKWREDHAGAGKEIDSEEARGRAEGLLKQMLDNPSLSQLLQDYLYKEFLDYNRESYQIQLFTEAGGNPVPYPRILKRDRVFLSALEAACKDLLNALNRIIPLSVSG